MNENISSQRARVLRELRRGRSLTPLEALFGFGCMRLAARVYELREAGNVIVTNWETDGHKKWARYTLEKLSPNEIGL